MLHVAKIHTVWGEFLWEITRQFYAEKFVRELLCLSYGLDNPTLGIGIALAHVKTTT